MAMSGRDIGGLIAIIRKSATEDVELSEETINAALTLLDGVLADIERIADALEVLAKK